MDFGSVSKAFRFRDLSVIRRNGKKATPPCPCGYLGHFSGRCACSPDRVANYRGRISGPLLDRIDLHVEVPALRESDLTEAPAGEPSASVRARVTAVRESQIARQGCPNALIRSGEVERWCTPDAAARKLLREAMSRLGLSARSFHRVLKVARTVADLAGKPGVGAAEVAEAIAYRNTDRGPTR